MGTLFRPLARRVNMEPWFAPRRWGLGSLAGCLCCWMAFSASAGPYSLQVVARRGDVIDGRTIDRFSFEMPVLAVNDNREVAFFAEVTESQFPIGRSAIFTQSRLIAGNGKTIAGVVPDLQYEHVSLDINNAGDVAFHAYLVGDNSPWTSAIFVRSQLRVREGDQIGGLTLGSVGESVVVSLNDSGQLAWHDHRTLYSTFSSGTLVATNGMIVDGVALSGVYGPRIGQDGRIALQSDQGIVIYDPHNPAQPRTFAIRPGYVVAGVEIAGIEKLTQFTAAGDIVALGWDNAGRHLLFTPTEILFRGGDLVDGQTVLGIVDGYADVNGRGDVAFLGAVQDSSFNGYHEALFVNGQMLLSAGDVFDGRTVASFNPFISHISLNERGDVAFIVEFEEQVDYVRQQAVVLALIPEPSAAALFWIAAATTCAAVGLSNRTKSPARRFQ